MKLVRNETSAPELKSGQFQSIAIHLKPAQVRHDTMNGRPHLVVPCVMMTEGVHEGSEGPLLYPEDELARDTSLWNMKPIVVYHPTVNGAPVSACDPLVIDKYGVGVLMNTRWEKDGLRTECWLEEDKTKQVDSRVLEALDSGEMMEVSTGLFLDVEGTEGTWNEEKYNGIARNHRPDHLAILPDLKGACSVEDGAGLLRNQSEGDDPKAKLAKYHLDAVNELSNQDEWTALNNLLRKSAGTDAWVIDIWSESGFFIYEDGKGGTWYQKYMVQDDEVKLEGIRVAAEKDIRYKLADGSYVGNTHEDNREMTMNEQERKKLVDKLIGNAKSPFTEEDRESLMGMDGDRLKWVANVQDTEESKETPSEPKPEPKPAESEEESKETPTENQEPKEPTVDEYIANAPQGIQDVLRSGVASHAAEKAKLIDKIVACERNPFSKEQLQEKDLEELKGLAKLAETPTVEPSPSPAAHFAGMAPVANPNTSEGTAEEPLVAPSINWDKKDE